MSARYEEYRGIFMEISYMEEGGCVACCDDPLEVGTLESPISPTPREAFDLLKAMIDRIYYELK